MTTMEDHHYNEQYSFDQRTVDAVADLLESFERPCVLRAPMVAVELEDRDTDVVALDIDERYRSLRDFQHWNLYHPRRLEQRFGVIFCGPAFFKASPCQLFNGLRVLAHSEFAQPLAVSYLTSRGDALLATFAPFGLHSTNMDLGYRAAEDCRKNEIKLFTNFPVRGTSA